MKDLLGREEAVTVERALKLLTEQPLQYPSVERTGIEDAYGRVLSSDVISPENLPGFNRSTMDGYAVNATDTFGASDSMPAYLTLAGEVHMGERPGFAIKRGEAAVIPTGGMLPEGADAVVMYEHTNMAGEDIIEVMKAVAPNENVILADEDVREGEVILKSGQRLRPQDIGALAGLGILEVEVFRRPVVAVISTGDEVVPPGNPLSAGEVRDINSYNLAGLIIRSGGIPLMKGIIRDDPGRLRAMLKEGIEEAQMVLISGGSSVGTRDYTARVIDELGPPGILFHGVSIKPGKPLIGGMGNGTPLFGLPGHPAAVSVCFETFIEPVLKRLSGERRRCGDRLPSHRTVRAFFGRNLASSTGREDHIRVALELKDDGLWARPILGKSGLIRTLVEADGVVVIPRNKNGIYEGETVEVKLFTDCPG